MTLAAPPRSAAITYAEDVIAGRAPAGRLVRLACQRFMRDLEAAPASGFYFDEDEAQWAIDFFPQLCKHSKGEWSGQPLQLQPWQAFIIGNLFGWKRVSDDLRRFRLAYDEVPRKNGKSTLAAGVGILLAFFDDEDGAEVYAAATKRDQAKIVFNEARQMVLKSPNVRRRVRVLTVNLNDPLTGSKFEPLGADADSMDGLNIHGRIVDELHAHKTREMWDVLETATGARRQPLGFVITTAGSNRNSVCYEQHEYAVKVLEGVITDETFFAYVATIDEDDDPFDPTSWAKANPNLGISVKVDDLERKANKAREIPAERNAFLMKHLDVWSSSASRWLSPELWAEGAGSGKALEGRPAYAGIHATNDMAALELWIPDGAGGGDVLSYFFIPEDKVGDIEREENAPYQAWADEGHVELTEGNVTDYDGLVKRLVQLNERFEIREVAIHAYNRANLENDLMAEGFSVVHMTSGFSQMHGPTEAVEALLLARKLRHRGNPVLRLMASNINVRMDAEKHKRPDDETSGGRIGGMRALIMAVGRAALHQAPEDPGPQIFLGGDDEEEEPI